MSLDTALGIARSGLAAVQRSLAQSSQNIANAETPGYTRKIVPQDALAVGDQPYGVRSGAAQRAVDAALAQRIEASRGAAAAAELREGVLAGIEQAHGDSGDTIGDQLGALRTAFTSLRDSPADAGAQRQVVDTADTLRQRLNDVSDAIGSARQQAQDGIVQEVAKANAALRRIADLTQRIRGTGSDTASLEDERDRAVATLGESIELQSVRRSDGDILLVARGGLVLPLDPDRDLFATSDATVAPDAYYGSGGTLPGVTMQGTDVTAQLAGGRLGESIALRDRTLPRYQAEVDLTAATLAARFDAEGLRLFVDADGTVPNTALPYASGTGTQIGFAGRMKLNPAVTAAPNLVRDGTHAVTGFTPNGAGGPAGFTTLIDRITTFTFGAEQTAGSAWPAIQTSSLGPDGTLASPFGAAPTLEAHASRLVASQTGDRAAAASAKEQAQQLTTALEARQAKTTGVDVDSEMAGMVALQNAYAANARVLGTVQSMWDSLLGAVR